MPYNAADRKDVRAAEKAASRAVREGRGIVLVIMEGASGRQWMYNLLLACHVFESSFALDPSTMAFREGERNIGLQILKDIMGACPDEYVLMMREANERDTVSERRFSEDTDGRDQGPESGPGGDAEHDGEAGRNDF